MKLICPTCGSKDLWQPHTKTSFDRILETHGYGRYDCRNCWKRSIFRFDRKAFHRDGSPREVVVEPPLQQEPVPEPVPATRTLAIHEPDESTVIGPTVLISGETFSREGMTIRGVLEGTLTMESYRLVIEPGGNVSADVTAGSITVRRDGTLAGQVRTPSFVVDDGANFNGKIELISR